MGYSFKVKELDTPNKKAEFFGCLERIPHEVTLPLHLSVFGDEFHFRVKNKADCVHAELLLALDYKYTVEKIL